MKSREVMIKRELFFRRILVLVFLGIIIFIFEFKIKRVVNTIFDWLPIIIFLVVVCQLIKDIKLKNWKRDNT